MFAPRALSLALKSYGLALTPCSKSANSVSGDVSLGAAVTKKCEGDILCKLSGAQKRVYDCEQKRCARKYQNTAGTMYRSFEAFCGAYAARDSSAKFLKASPGGRK